ncbi:uncharacterized protein LOC141659883 [Apium graveolens]|uniref:uncharacterized protein LOC141659883 n=1 Tax=Apium graveolens TaxID=4045 RepID=UPI003D7B4F01
MSKATMMETGKNKSGVVGLTYPMLTRSNYTTWALKMKVFMQAHSVWETIEPKDPKATKVNEKTDKVAMAMIYQGIPEEILLSVAENETAKEIASTIEQFGDLENMTVEEAVGSLKAHEERMKGQNDKNGGGELLLTEDEWLKKEGEERKLLFTRDEWLKRSNKNGAEATSMQRVRGARDKSKVRCYNCSLYDHYAAKYRKPR